MPTRKFGFAEGEYYHVYNRGVERRDLFRVQGDYERFLLTLFACNDRERPFHGKDYPRGLTSGFGRQRRRVPAASLVDILCFCLMPNHYHLLIRQRSPDGVPTYLQKVGTAYTMYFNARYERSGVLFQGTYKSVRVSRDSYLFHLSRYIHLNPLDLVQPSWRERGITRTQQAQRFLRRYLWSSYADYLGEERYGSFLQTDPISSEFRSGLEYGKFVEEWRPGGLRRLGRIVIE